MNGRVYDPLTAMFFSPDPYLQSPDNWLNYNRYTYCLNNPFRYTDPSGEYFGIDDLIAAAIGGVVNLVVNACQGNLGGHGVWGAIGRGAAAFGAGAVAGWGALYPEFGGWAWGGATVGAASSGLNSLLNQYFKQGVNWAQVGLSALAGGLLSYGTYELSSYIGWKTGGDKLGEYEISYKQYKTMQADYQRSRFWQKEYGGILTKDGGVVRAPAAYREKYGVNFDAAWTGQVSADNMATHYHTHWDANNRLLGYTPTGQEVRTANGPSDIDLSFVGNTKHLVSNGMLIDRGTLYYYNMHGVTNNLGSTFLRYFPLYWWWNMNKQGDFL